MNPANPTPRSSNIEWAVRLTHAYTDRILGMNPANPTARPGNIGWAFRLTDAYTN
jgi:hypothetical protein